MRIKALALASVFSLLAAPSFAQVIIGGGGSGGGGGGGSGTVTNVATGAGLTGGPITTTGTISATEALGNGGAAITATTYHASPTNDAAKQLLFTGTSASAWDDAGTGTTAAGLGFDIVNAGTANVTYTPAAGIDGTASLVVPFGSWAHVFYDGTTWRSEPGKNLSGVTAGTYGDSTHCASVTVDKYGRATAASQSTSCPGAGAAAFASNWQASNWYVTVPGFVAAGVNIGTTTTQWIPKFFDKAVTIGALGVNITTLSAAGNIQLSVYAAGTNGLPTGSALCTTASLSTAVATNVSNTCSTAIPAAGMYWLGMQVDNATAAVKSFGPGMTNWLIGTTSLANMGGNTTTDETAYTTTGGTFGTWPSNPTITQAGTSTNSVPNIRFQIASVP